MMNRPSQREIGIDLAMVLGGAGASLLFVCTDGNGQSPLPLLAPVSVGMAINAAVCLLLARFVTGSRTLAALGGIIITVLVYLNLAMHSVARTPRADPCVAMLPMIIIVTTAPMVLFGSVGFARLGVALFRKRQDQRTQQPSPRDSSKAADGLTGTRDS